MLLKISDICTTYCVACDISRAHGRAVRSSKTKATGVRVLLDTSVARVPLGAATAAAECSCARDCLDTSCSCFCLVLVALEQSSDRGPVSVFCGAII